MTSVSAASQTEDVPPLEIDMHRFNEDQLRTDKTDESFRLSPVFTKKTKHRALKSTHAISDSLKFSGVATSA